MAGRRTRRHPPRPGRRVPSRNRARLAPRRAELRAGVRRLARRRGAHALPPFPGPAKDSFARAGAALGLYPGRRGALALAAQHSADPGAALLDHLPHHGGMSPWLAFVTALLVAQPQAEAPNSLLLVAKPSLTDPNFRETVVLVTQAADASTVGVILNRAT